MFRKIKDLLQMKKTSRQMTQSMNEWKLDEERFKTLSKEEFLLVEDDKLLHAALTWIFEKTKALPPKRHLEILKTLPLPCQMVIAANALDGEVNNGGFNQYYFNDGHLLPASGADALSAIVADKLADIAARAHIVYLENKDSFANRHDATMQDFADSYENNPLNPFDDEYYKASNTESFGELIAAYIRANIDCFGD